MTDSYATINRWIGYWCSVTMLVLGCCLTARAGDHAVNFNRDIRPILSNVCYQCHGPDAEQREADLRLDTKTGALTKLESGETPIVPGDSASSLVYQRISASDPDERMPPSDSGKKLTPKQIHLIKRWIDAGADWHVHWSLVPPVRPPVPKLRDQHWVTNPIDTFILARLEQEHLMPNPPAKKTTLIRRVTLDLTGLPPTIAEIDAFLADGTPNAYEKVVDRLLRSPHYGEHIARYWLDLARYGDTHGLHLDNERSIWPYRDWVIRAFNKNMPFDQFTIEQLAGDLLPNPTVDQRIATGFNRCNVTTSEGGSIDAEYLVRYAVDRAETTSTVWMGLTAGCAVCHDHKFDPISQKEFYQLFGYFFSQTEKAMDGNALLPPPFLKVPTPEQTARLKELQQAASAIEAKIQTALTKVEYRDPKVEQAAVKPERHEFVWIDDALPSGAKAQTSGSGASQWQFVSQPEHPVFSGTKAIRRSTKGVGQHFFTGARPGLRLSDGDILFASVYLDPDKPPDAIMLQFNDGSWEHRAYWGKDLINFGKNGTPSRLQIDDQLPKLGRWIRLEVPAAKVGLKPGSVLNGWAFTQHNGTVYWDRAGVLTTVPEGGFESLQSWVAAQKGVKNSSISEPIRIIVDTDPKKQTKAQKNQLRDYFVEQVYSKTRPLFEPLHQELTAAKKARDEFEKSIPATLVMEDMATPRETYVLKRGEYDKPDKSQEVTPNVPAALPPLPEDAPPNRLTLARWLVDPAHPLTARVMVNRLWQQLFGIGIVKTAEDFGSQGEWPSHPKLLDWLACEFMASHWDVKHMMKLLVMSSTYRQSSRSSVKKQSRDPSNRLLARGPRFRMDAEMIRDTALAASGLLVETIGGKSVKPYQPAGIWKAVGYTDSNTANFVQDHGAALYRRSLYTFWKRTAPPPSMVVFDAPSRESCSARRPRTNTPMQALTLMNDVQFVEAARGLAQRIMTEGGNSPKQKISLAFRLATARCPKPDELNVLLAFYQTQRRHYENEREAASQLIQVGESKIDESLDPAELAAWTLVTNVILNLDETITKG